MLLLPCDRIGSSVTQKTKKRNQRRGGKTNRNRHETDEQQLLIHVVSTKRVGHIKICTQTGSSIVSDADVVNK